MRLQAWIWRALVAAALVPTVVLAVDKADAPKTDEAKPAATAATTDQAKKPVLEGESAVMVREANLSEDQQAKLVQIMTDLKTEMATWETTNAEKIQAFTTAVAAARQAQDAAALRKAVADAEPVLQARQAIESKYANATMDLMTPEQKTTWVGFLIWFDLTSRTKPLNLTPDQLAKTRAICNASAKVLVAMPTPKEPAPADLEARRGIHQKIITRFMEDVLTDAQRAKMRPAAAPPAPAPPAPAPKG